MMLSILVLRIVAVFELAVAVVVAVKLSKQMSLVFDQFSFAMLLFDSRLMFHHCNWWLAAHLHDQS